MKAVGRGLMSSIYLIRGRKKRKTFDQRGNAIQIKINAESEP